MKIIRRIFPYRDQKCKPLQGKPCFNRQIGLCPGVCTGEITSTEYAKTIWNLKLFFEGKKSKLIKTLEKDMKGLAKSQEFEKAAKIRQTIYALNHIQDVSLIKREPQFPKRGFGEFKTPFQETVFRIEAYDIAHLSGKDTTGVMVVVEDGEMNKAEYRKFKIKGNQGVNDVAALKEVLRRRFNHPEWRNPNLIVLDGSTAQLNAAKEIVKDIKLVAVVKNAAHKPERILGDEDIIRSHQKSILLSNSEAHRFVIAYHKKLRGKSFI